MLHSEVTTTAMDPYEKAKYEYSGGLWIVLARAFRSVEVVVSHSIESLGIGSTDFMVLEALLHLGPLTMSSLCRKVLLANTSMTSAVDRLEKKGLIGPIDSPPDRRTRMVALTPQGHEFFKPLFERHLKDVDAIMAGIPSSDRTEVRRILKSIGYAAQDKLKQLNGKAKPKKKVK